jgi:hypothetical protein
MGIENIKEIIIPENTTSWPSKRKFLFRAGFKSFPDATSTLGETANAIYKLAMGLSSPHVEHKIFDVKDVDPGLIPAKFKGIKRISYFVSTIGQDFDSNIEEFMEKEKVLEGTLLDAWGSESTEAINVWFDTILRKRYGEGTMRFSPGYGDISVLKNILLLDLLSTTKVTANIKSGILLPRKSTTCMIGWFK